MLASLRVLAVNILNIYDYDLHHNKSTLVKKKKTGSKWLLTPRKINPKCECSCQVTLYEENNEDREH